MLAIRIYFSISSLEEDESGCENRTSVSRRTLDIFSGILFFFILPLKNQSNPICINYVYAPNIGYLYGFSFPKDGISGVEVSVPPTLCNLRVRGD